VLTPNNSGTLSTVTDMTYDELYDYVVKYVAMPHTTITAHDHHRACLILGAFFEFILDCQDAGVDLNTIDTTGIVNLKLDEIGA
jgi:hypothetical protein